MQTPEFHGSLPVAPDTLSFASTLPLPGLGALSVNAFLVRGSQPTLIDTGLPGLQEELVSALVEAIDPADLRWLWLTHCDVDHIGALERVLELAPSARVVTNYLGMGKLGMRGTVAPERFFLINPGQSLTVGDRELEAVAMPTYDAPETMGVFDRKTRTLFSSDCFGGLFDDATLGGALDGVGSVPAKTLEEGMVTWAGVDAPWLSSVRADAFQARLEELRQLTPQRILSAHLPPAEDLESLLRSLDAARHAEPFVGPDQAALETMMAAVA